MLSVPHSGSPPAEAIERAVDALRSGGLVAMPTETVYGLAARADDAGARPRLTRGKGSRPDRRFTWHVGGFRDFLDHVELPRVVGRIAERYWPGPLTLVARGEFEGLEGIASEGWVGVRAPAHDATRAVLDAAPFPVVMSSANRAGEPPLLEAGPIRETFGSDEVELVLDGGASSLGQSSTVAAVGPGRFEVLREGIVSADELERTAGLSLLFVCTGNTCRSPMAEALARAALREALETEDERTFGFDVASAGVFASPGAPASSPSVEVLAERGIDLSSHASSPAIDRDVLARDHVYCMTAGHRDALLATLPPAAASRIELLDPEGGDVPDPFGAPTEVYRETANAIEGFIRARLGEWV